MRRTQLKFLQHSEKYFLNILKSNQIWIVFTPFQLIWHQAEFRLVPNQSENGKCNLISVWFNNIRKIFHSVSHSRQFKDEYWTRNIFFDLEEQPKKIDFKFFEKYFSAWTLSSFQRRIMNAQFIFKDE